MLEQLIASARSNPRGITTADSHFRSIETCFDGEFCPIKLFGAASQEKWIESLKEAESRLTYSHAEMEVKDITTTQVTKGACMDFDCVLTATGVDRDGDILESKGAIVDPRMPLLWQHIPLQPCGKLVAVISQSDKSVVVRNAIIDNEFGRDVAQLVEFGALRISHGFAPKTFAPLKDGGWHIKEFDVLESSVVSIPANPSAVITAFSRGKLHHPLVKGWAKKKFDERPTTVAFSVKEQKQGCGCSTKKHDIKKVIEKHVDETDPVRWNTTLSKAFDVSNQHLEPSRLEYDWVSRYCSCEIKQLRNITTTVESVKLGSFLMGLRHVTSDHKTEDVRRITSEGKECPPIYELIELNSKNRENFLVDGIAFHRGLGGHYVLKFIPSWYGMDVTIYTRDGQQHIGEKILDETWNWVSANNYLKGEAFSISGSFIKKTSETWENLFLDPKNETAVKRVIKTINEKGKSAANRGMVFMGPPGTGKTLSGRITINEAKSTFIWVSARDFYRMGAFGGLKMAFDLAKDLAPSVIFVEDVDNWMSDYTIDFLKTEMDGIGRSTGVTTILTTNFPERFPEALLDRPGRFHDVLKFDLPDENTRTKMLRKWVDGITPEELAKAVKDTDGYSGAHLYELAQFAKTLCEQDELAISDALFKALDKIREQRDLITESQLSGSNFRVRRAMSDIAPVKHWNGRKSDDMDEDDKREGTCRKCGHKAPMNEFMGEPDGECSFDAVKTISAMLIESDSGTRSRVKQIVDGLCAADERMELDALLEV